MYRSLQMLSLLTAMRLCVFLNSYSEYVHRLGLGVSFVMKSLWLLSGLDYKVVEPRLKGEKQKQTQLSLFCKNGLKFSSPFSPLWSTLLF